jgi:hypothetical protein
MGEWIEWKGGLCPVPFTAAVQVQYRSGNLSVGSFIADEFKWSHVGCTADIIAYRVIEPEQPSEQAHMMAAPTTERKHVSDAAWQAFIRANGQGIYREEVELFRRNEGTVLLTVAEHDEIISDLIARQRRKVELAAERDSLRAEVEQLRVQLAGCGVAAMGNTRAAIAKAIKPGEYGWSASYGDVLRAVGREIALREDNERLRKGVMPNADQEERTLRLESTNAVAGDASAKTRALLTVAQADHRLGTQLPDGEPVGPMSQRKPYRWGMV